MQVLRQALDSYTARNLERSFGICPKLLARVRRYAPAGRQARVGVADPPSFGGIMLSCCGVDFEYQFGRRTIQYF